MKICPRCGNALHYNSLTNSANHVCSITSTLAKREAEKKYGIEMRSGVYMFMPVRMPGQFTILSWIVYCPDGCLYSENSFSDACIKMDLHAAEHEGKGEVA